MRHLLILACLCVFAHAEKLDLSEDEKQWLANKPVIKVGMPLGMPGLSQYNGQSGELEGLWVDYLAVLGEKTGATFEVYSQPWPDLMISASRGNIDFFPCAQNKAAKLSMDVTQEIHRVSHIFVVEQKTSESELDEAWLRGKKVAVIENNHLHQYLQTLPNIEIVLVDSAEKGLNSVAQGHTDAFATHELSIQWSGIGEENKKNLKIGGIINCPQTSIRFAVRKDWPIFKAIIDKAIAVVDTPSREGILSKWSVPEEVDDSTLRSFIFGLVISGLLLVSILATFIFWKRRFRLARLERAKGIVQKKEQLAVNEEQQRLLQQATSDGMWDWDVNSSRINWSARSYMILGYPVDAFEVTYEEWENLVHTDDLPECRKRLKRTIQTGKPLSMEYRCRKRDGEWIWILAKGYCVGRDGQGKIARIIGTYVDLSERKAAEAKLEEQNRKLAEVNEALIESHEQAKIAIKAKDEFLAVISHELRTPLNPILGFSELLLDELPDDSPMQDSVNLIRGSSLKMLDLIDEILEFTRIQKYDLKPDPSPITINDLVQSCIAICASKTEGKLTILVENGHTPRIIPYNEDEAIIADANMLQQLITNLLINAYKYSKGQPVTLRIGFSARKSNRLRVEIQDQGIGISTELQRDIFIAFYQIESAHTRKYEGLGLGLAICKKIIDLNDGSIGLESEPDEGSTFWFEFPVDTIFSDGSEEDSSLETSEFTSHLEVLLPEEHKASVSS